MNVRRQNNEGGGQRRPSNDNLVKGAILVLIAVVVGVVILANFDSGSSSSKPTTSTTTTIKGGTTTVPSGGITVPAVTTVPAAGAFKVVVANASGVQGAAGRTTTALKTAGFATVDPVTATAKITVSIVYVLPGFEAAGTRVAAALKLPAARVQPMPSPLPVPTLNGAQVLVILGSDIAK